MKIQRALPKPEDLSSSTLIKNGSDEAGGVEVSLGGKL